MGLYFFWRSWTSCLDTWHHGFYQIPTDKKNQQVTDSVINLRMGHVWIFQPYNNPNTNLKNNTVTKFVARKEEDKVGLWRLSLSHNVQNPMGLATIKELEGGKPCGGLWDHRTQRTKGVPAICPNFGIFVNKFSN